MIYGITPIPKPRMTRADKWKKRPCVQKYWDFKDEVRRLNIDLPESGAHVIFYLPIPKNGIKRLGKPHQQKPDCDNLLKALMDAIYDDDAHIYDIRVSKFWSEKGYIEIN